MIPTLCYFYVVSYSCNLGTFMVGEERSGPICAKTATEFLVADEYCSHIPNPGQQTRPCNNPACITLSPYRYVLSACITLSPYRYVLSASHCPRTGTYSVCITLSPYKYILSASHCPLIGTYCLHHTVPLQVRTACITLSSL